MTSLSSLLIYYDNKKFFQTQWISLQYKQYNAKAALIMKKLQDLLFF